MKALALKAPAVTTVEVIVAIIAVGVIGVIVAVEMSIGDGINPTKVLVLFKAPIGMIVANMAPRWSDGPPTEAVIFLDVAVVPIRIGTLALLGLRSRHAVISQARTILSGCRDGNS